MKRTHQWLATIVLLLSSCSTVIAWTQPLAPCSNRLISHRHTINLNTLIPAPSSSSLLLTFPSSRRSSRSSSSSSLIHQHRYQSRGGEGGSALIHSKDSIGRRKSLTDLQMGKGGEIEGDLFGGGRSHASVATAAVVSPPQSPSTIIEAVAATTQQADGASSSDAAAVHKRLAELERRIQGIDRSMVRLENLIASKRGVKKTVVVSYDIGPNATIDSTDIASAAGCTFFILGMLVGRSLAKNLWLVGGLIGGWLASYLAREEAPGGPISDVVQDLGLKVATKYREIMFMYTTGQLSYVYFKKWQEIDQRYGIMMKVEQLKFFAMDEKKRLEAMEKKYELRYRIGNFLKGTYNGSITLVASIFNAKDRKDLLKKLPKPFRYLFMSKAQRRIEERRRYRVTKFCGFRDGSPVVEVDDDD